MSKIYWEYAGTQYRKKFQAYEAAGFKSNQITAHFYDSTFDSYNWSVEPSQTHQELLTERAFQIRDKYKYIKFYFSGGADSTTMLNVFLKNNIYIDEIIVYRFSPISDFDCISNIEVNNYTIPFLKSLNLSKTKIKIMDHGSDYYNKLLSDDRLFRVNNTTDLREFFTPRINGNNFCHLFGAMEPRVFNIDNKWYFIHYDSDNWAEARFRNQEFFFASPDLPALLAKEAHMLKHTYKKLHMTGFEDNHKDVSSACLRNTPVAPVLPYLRKNVSSVKNVIKGNPKLFYMLKNSDSVFRDRYQSFLSTKINNKRIVDLFDGHVLCKYYLGE